MKKLVVYSGKNCAACVALKTKMASENIQYEEKDVSKNMQDVKMYSIRSVPTTLVFEDDNYLTTVVGNKLEEIKSFI